MGFMVTVMTLVLIMMLLQLFAVINILDIYKYIMKKLDIA